MTPWTVALQAPLSMGYSRQEYWNELPCPPSRDLSNPGPEPMSPALVGRFFTTEPPGKPIHVSILAHLPSHPSCHMTSSRIPSYTGPFLLSVLNGAVCACPSQTSPGNRKFILFPFCTSVHRYHVFLDSACKGYHMIFLLLYLTYFIQYDNFCENSVVSVISSSL